MKKKKKRTTKQNDDAHFSPHKIKCIICTKNLSSFFLPKKKIFFFTEHYKHTRQEQSQLINYYFARTTFVTR